MFYLYKIINKINQKIYIGVHKSIDIENDNYMGSGVLLDRAIKKYGISNFERIILKAFNDMTEAYEAEKEIVNESFVKRDDTYNLNIGGFGGRYFMNSTKTFDDLSNAGIKGAKALHSKPLHEKKEIYKKISKANKGKKYNSGTFTDPKETSRKRREKMIGKKLCPKTRKWISKEEYEKIIKSI